MMSLNDETIRNLFNTNQTAIQQLGEDIIKLNTRMDEKHKEVDVAMKSFQRDINDRWQMISDLVKETEKLLNVE